MGLFELLKDFINFHDDKRKQNALLEQCLNASKSDLEELSKLLRSSPEDYLPIVKTFVSHLYNEKSRATPRIKKQSAELLNFTSLLITIIIIKNLHHSDIPGFEELLHNCIELLWLDNNKDNNKYNKFNQTNENV